MGLPNTVIVVIFTLVLIIFLLYRSNRNYIEDTTVLEKTIKEKDNALSKIQNTYTHSQAIIEIAKLKDEELKNKQNQIVEKENNYQALTVSHANIIQDIATKIFEVEEENIKQKHDNLALKKHTIEEKNAMIVLRKRLDKKDLDNTKLENVHDSIMEDVTEHILTLERNYAEKEIELTTLKEKINKNNFQALNQSLEFKLHATQLELKKFQTAHEEIMNETTEKMVSLDRELAIKENELSSLKEQIKHVEYLSLDYKNQKEKDTKKIQFLTENSDKRNKELETLKIKLNNVKIKITELTSEHESSLSAEKNKLKLHKTLLTETQEKVNNVQEQLRESMQEKDRALAKLDEAKLSHASKQSEYDSALKQISNNNTILEMSLISHKEALALAKDDFLAKTKEYEDMREKYHNALNEKMKIIDVLEDEKLNFTTRLKHSDELALKRAQTQKNIEENLKKINTLEEKIYTKKVKLEEVQHLHDTDIQRLDDKISDLEKLQNLQALVNKKSLVEDKNVQHLQFKQSKKNKKNILAIQTLNRQLAEKENELQNMKEINTKNTSYSLHQETLKRLKNKESIKEIAKSLNITKSRIELSIKFNRLKQRH